MRFRKADFRKLIDSNQKLRKAYIMMLSERVEQLTWLFVNMG
jgi:hypothetical protein